MPTQLTRQKLGSLDIIGFSLAGEESVVAVPELNIAFDVGRAPRELISIDYVCLSHGHMDHAAGIAYYFSQRNFVGNAPGCALMHKDLVAPVQDLLRAWAKLEGHPSPARLIGMGPEQTHPIRRDLIVRAFPVVHGAGALGFVAVEVRHKLKPEFAGLSGPQLVELKRKGTQIEYRLEVPRVAYCGDTAAGPFLKREDVANVEVLILECTFFDPDHVQRARAGQHIHVKDLPRALEGTNAQHILLTHVTRRTPLRTAKQALRALLAPSLHDRVTLLMDRRPRRHET
jgi:ribonuclease Z